jgi:hypothetical protein
MSQYLKSCTTWQELQEAFLQHRPNLNHIHMTALISNLAKTAPSASSISDDARAYSQLMQDALLLVSTKHSDMYVLTAPYHRHAILVNASLV